MHLVEQQECAQHGRRDLQPGIAPPPAGQPGTDRGRDQPRRPDQRRGDPVELRGGQLRQPPVPDRVRRQVRLAAGLEPVRGPPALRAGQQHGQVQREPGARGAAGHPQRAPEVPVGDPLGQQRQGEEAGVDLDRRSEAEQRTRGAGPAAGPDQHGAGHAGGGQEVPVVHPVQHDGRGGGPDHRAPAGQPDQQQAGQQAEREQQQRGRVQVVGVGVGAQAGQPHEHAGGHRVLHRTTDQLAAVGAGDEPALQVGEQVLAHPATDPELLDVAVAEIAILQLAEPGRDAVTVEGRSGALPLQQV